MAHKVDNVNQGDRVDEETLFELLHDVVHRFKAALHAAIAEDDAGLAVMEVRALAYIARHPDATAGDLVKRSGRDKGQVARLVAELTEHGLVERAEGTDRRTQTLHLTTEGKAVHRRLDRKRAHATAAMFAPFSTAERSTLAALLRRLANAPPS